MIKWKCIFTHSGDLDDVGECFFRGSVLPHGDVKWDVGALVVSLS